jgi:AcrR family transcriptional regulator
VTKRDQQRIERREQILACGLDILISCGYEAMKIRDIAEGLQISTGLFFNYFDSKEKLYAELIKIGLSGPENMLKFIVPDAKPIDVFEKMTFTIFEALKSDSFTAKMFVLMAQTINSETAPESVKNQLANYDMLTPFLPVVAQGQQFGAIKPGNPTALILAYWGAVQGVAENLALRPDLPLPESSWIVDILRA